MAAGAHWHLPLMHDFAVDADEIDVAAGRLRRDERIAARGKCAIVGDEADATAALGNLVDGCHCGLHSNRVRVCSGI